MLNKTNAHFEELLKIGRDYEEKKRALEDRKQGIIETYGWESDELKAWYDEKNKMVYPVAAGACKAYRAWSHTIEKEGEELELDDFLWDREVADFVDCLRDAGIKTFIYTNQSTAVMENLHAFEKEGCRMDGLCTIKRMERSFGEDREETILGIHFTVC